MHTRSIISWIHLTSNGESMVYNTQLLLESLMEFADVLRDKDTSWHRHWMYFQCLNAAAAVFGVLCSVSSLRISGHLTSLALDGVRHTLWQETEGRFTHSTPCPCRASKGLECVFPIWFTQCGRVWFTLAMPRPCHALAMTFFSRPRHSTAVERRPVGYLPAFGFFRLPRGVPRRLLSEA